MSSDVRQLTLQDYYNRPDDNKCVKLGKYLEEFKKYQANRKETRLSEIV